MFEKTEKLSGEETAQIAIQTIRTVFLLIYNSFNQPDNFVNRILLITVLH